MLDASISYAESHSESRALQSEKKRDERDKARTEGRVTRARQYKSEAEEARKKTR